MFGEIDAWFYKGLGGIFPDEEYPGYKNVVLKPHFVSGLQQFEATHTGPYGKIVSSWKKPPDGVEYNVTIPANSTATLLLDGRDVKNYGKGISEDKNIQIISSSDGKLKMHLKSGSYHFLIKIV